MQELLEYILKSMVSHPDDISIEKSEEGDDITFNITLHDEDKGLVIGKEGRTIKSIRNILAVIAIQQSKKVFVKVLD